MSHPRWTSNDLAVVRGANRKWFVIDAAGTGLEDGDELNLRVSWHLDWWNSIRDRVVSSAFNTYNEGRGGLRGITEGRIEPLYTKEGDEWHGRGEPTTPEEPGPTTPNDPQQPSEPGPSIDQEQRGTVPFNDFNPESGNVNRTESLPIYGNLTDVQGRLSAYADYENWQKNSLYEGALTPWELAGQTGSPAAQGTAGQSEAASERQAATAQTVARIQADAQIQVASIQAGAGIQQASIAAGATVEGAGIGAGATIESAGIGERATLGGARISGAAGIESAKIGAGPASAMVPAHIAKMAAETEVAIREGKLKEVQYATALLGLNDAHARSKVAKGLVMAELQGKQLENVLMTLDGVMRLSLIHI